ncbi:arylamine N-acetyltransferase family protein [Streptacidiphilus neutrinimicus]|uniref:arylamine N-acetyltransferase family protein n=1 Tax=Streptacidiphilus neutrinimicus TaxID=105420 RepID=UPI0005AB1C7E|nr:arylamine N-acetyltransferase [Streptacidiphilus neutrinimicus]
MTLSGDQVTAYLSRIGAARPARPDAEALRDLHLRHLRAVPFENLSIHLGEPIVLEPDALFDKVVGRGRGGFCYELNGLFAELLDALGYRVTRLAGRVHGPDGFGPLFDHLALRVADADGAEWLVDVGFGRHTDLPLRFDPAVDQRDPTGGYRLDGRPGDTDVVVSREGEPQYLLELRPRTLSDFEVCCWWQQTSPSSHFAQNVLCSLRTPTGRVTVSGRTLVESDDSGRRTERELTDNELTTAYAELFGIVLDRVPDRPRSRG